MLRIPMAVNITHDDGNVIGVKIAIKVNSDNGANDEYEDRQTDQRRC